MSDFSLGRLRIPNRPGSDEVYFNSVPDDYIGAVHKLKAIVRYASKRKYDLLLKVDDDTFLSREMLGHLFENPQHDYLGHCLPLEDGGKTDGYFAAGGAYRLSSKALSVLANAVIPEKPGRIIAEDQWVSCNLHAKGINAVHDPNIQAIFGDAKSWLVAQTPLHDQNFTSSIGTSSTNTVQKMWRQVAAPHFKRKSTWK